MMEVEPKPPDDATASSAVDEGQTILPAPVATLCSIGATAIRGGVSLSRAAISLPYSACRYTTLSTIEGGRYCFHTLLGSAAQDVFLRAQNDRDRDTTVEVMKSWSDTGNRWITNVALFAEMGFQNVEAGSGFLADSIDLAARLCDSLFGATGSSRALRSICAVLLNEFRNPITTEEQIVRKRDLVWALVAMMYLQHWSRRWDEEEDTRLGVEQVIWDVVVEQGDGQGQRDLVLRNGGRDDSDASRPEVQLWKQIRESIPPGATVAISTSVTKTITVDVTGSDPAIEAPPGFELVEQRRLISDSDDTPTVSQENLNPGTHRIVFKVEQHREIKNPDQLINSRPQEAGQILDAMDLDDVPPTDPAQTPPRRIEELPPPVLPKDDVVMEDLDNGPPPTPPPKPPMIHHGNQNKGPMGERRHSSMVSTASRSPKLTKSRPVPLDISPSSPSSRQRPVVPRKENGHGSLQTEKSNGKKGGLRAALKRGLLLKDNGRTSYQTFLDHAQQDADHSSRPRRGSIDDRASLVSANDTYSICTMRSDNAHMPSPPVMVNGVSLTSSTTQAQRSGDTDLKSFLASPRHHRHSSSIPSIYTHGNSSQGSLVVAQYRRPTAYSDQEAIETLRTNGSTTSQFPQGPLVHTVFRYMRFASAAYGSRFINVCNFGNLAKYTEQGLDDQPIEIRAYARHTGIQRADILLAPFVDTQGGPGATASMDTSTGNFSLCHTVSIDIEAQAVVLAVRGTYDFEDILIDLACTYDDLSWRGKSYKVHKGVYASAQRILSGEDGRVMKVIHDALEQNPGFGLVLCGHSLGGAVTALLGIMLAEPAASGPNFVTSSKKDEQTTSKNEEKTTSKNDEKTINLPPNRPTHVFAYGPPGTMSPSLRLATRGLITSIVHGHDIVPFLSLGVLHDLRAAAVAIRADAADDNNKIDGGARAEVWRSISRDVRELILSRFRRSDKTTVPTDDKVRQGPPRGEGGNDEWAFAALQTLRASMQSLKLVPPGEVLQVQVENESLVARRVVLKHIRDVEVKFRELRLGVAQLADHFPWKYEEALALLRDGVGDLGAGA